MEAFSLFNIGFGELAFILVLAGIFLGPQRIRGVARYLGRLAGQSQQIMHNLRVQLNSELDTAEQAELKAALADFEQLRREVAELKQAVRPATIFGQNGAGSQPSLNGYHANGAEPSIGRPAVETAKLPRPLDIDDDPA